MEEFEAAARAVADLPDIPAPLLFQAHTPGITTGAAGEPMEPQSASHTLHRD